MTVVHVFFCLFTISSLLINGITGMFTFGRWWAVPLILKFYQAKTTGKVVLKPNWTNRVKVRR